MAERSPKTADVKQRVSGGAPPSPAEVRALVARLEVDPALAPADVPGLAILCAARFPLGLNKPLVPGSVERMNAGALQLVAEVAPEALVRAGWLPSPRLSVPLADCSGEFVPLWSREEIRGAWARFDRWNAAELAPPLESLHGSISALKAGASSESVRAALAALSERGRRLLAWIGWIIARSPHRLASTRRLLRAALRRAVGKVNRDRQNKVKWTPADLDVEALHTRILGNPDVRSVFVGRDGRLRLNIRGSRIEALARQYVLEQARPVPIASLDAPEDAEGQERKLAEAVVDRRESAPMNAAEATLVPRLVRAVQEAIAFARGVAAQEAATVWCLARRLRALAKGLGASRRQRIAAPRKLWAALRAEIASLPLRTDQRAVAYNYRIARSTLRLAVPRARQAVRKILDSLAA